MQQPRQLLRALGPKTLAAAERHGAGPLVPHTAHELHEPARRHLPPPYGRNRRQQGSDSEIENGQK